MAKPNSRTKNIVTETVTIAASGTVSTAVQVNLQRLVGVFMPSAWTAADITFKAAIEDDGTYVDVYDADGNQVTISSPDASRFIALQYSAMEGLSNLKLESSQAQAAERVITLVFKNGG